MTTMTQRQINEFASASKRIRPGGPDGVAIYPDGTVLEFAGRPTEFLHENGTQTYALAVTRIPITRQAAAEILRAAGR